MATQAATKPSVFDVGRWGAWALQTMATDGRDRDQIGGRVRRVIRSGGEGPWVPGDNKSGGLGRKNRRVP